jgi:hypothetical protein
VRPAATVLIAIVAAAPVLSSAGVGLAQQPIMAKLSIENQAIVQGAGCPVTSKEKCPQGEKNGLTTTQFNGKTDQYPLGPWLEKTEKYIDIPIGSEYKITTKVPIDLITFQDPINHHSYEFSHYKTSIFLRNTKERYECIISCTGVMVTGTLGNSAVVSYYWESKTK